MEILEKIAQIYVDNRVIGLFLVPMALSFFAYSVYKRRDEFSYHAIQNIAASIMIVGMNFFVIIYFVREINAFAQGAYYWLGIPTLPSDFWAGTPFWILCILGLIAKDFVDYWNHRAMHTIWLWPTHAAHHSDTHVNAFTTFRVHFLESLFMGLSYVVLLTWLQMPGAIPLVYLFSHLHNLYVHTNLPYQHGPLNLLIASPQFHRWHHADTPKVYGKNLANVIPLWDWLFGTYYFPGPCDVEMGAKASGVEDKNPFLIFVYPFQRWTYLIRSRLLKPRQDGPVSAPVKEPAHSHSA